MAGLGAAVAQSGAAVDCCRSGAPVADAAGQGRRHRLASREQPDTPIWSLAAQRQSAISASSVAMTLEITLGNELPVPAVAQLARARRRPGSRTAGGAGALSPGAKETFAIPLRHAGTFMCDLRLLGDGQARPSPARALVVRESEPVAVDRDEVFLIEDWRLRPDGTAIAPGTDPKDTTPHLHHQWTDSRWISQPAPMNA